MVSLPDGEIVFSGLEFGNKFIKTEIILPETYVSRNDCEKNLVRFKGKNKISEVDSFFQKSTKIVTDHEPLSDSKRSL